MSVPPREALKIHQDSGFGPKQANRILQISASKQQEYYENKFPNTFQVSKLLVQQY